MFSVREDSLSTLISLSTMIIGLLFPFTFTSATAGLAVFFVEEKMDCLITTRYHFHHRNSSCDAGARRFIIQTTIIIHHHLIMIIIIYLLRAD